MAHEIEIRTGLTEDQIERRVERLINDLDRWFLNPRSGMTEATYNERMAGISAWSDECYRWRKR